MRIPDMVPVSDFRQDAANLLRRVQDTNQPLVVTQRGRAAAILLSVDEYERREREFEILQLLVNGEKEIAKGRGHTLPEVMSEADAFLDELDR